MTNTPVSRCIGAGWPAPSSSGKARAHEEPNAMWLGEGCNWSWQWFCKRPHGSNAESGTEARATGLSEYLAWIAV